MSGHGRVQVKSSRDTLKQELALSHEEERAQERVGLPMHVSDFHLSAEQRTVGCHAGQAFLQHCLSEAGCPPSDCFMPSQFDIVPLVEHAARTVTV